MQGHISNSQIGGIIKQTKPVAAPNANPATATGSENTVFESHNYKDLVVPSNLTISDDKPRPNNARIAIIGNMTNVRVTGNLHMTLRSATASELVSQGNITDSKIDGNLIQTFE